MAKIGSSWADESWSDIPWAENTWAGAGTPVVVATVAGTGRQRRGDEILDALLSIREQHIDIPEIVATPFVVVEDLKALAAEREHAKQLAAIVAEKDDEAAIILYLKQAWRIE